jgi:hypothetical protein
MIAILQIIKIPLYMNFCNYKNGRIIAILQIAIYKKSQIIAILQIIKSHCWPKMMDSPSKLPIRRRSWNWRLIGRLRLIGNGPL